VLLPVHNVVLSADAEEARAIARTALDHYFSLTNYVSSWKRLGFTDADADVTRPGKSERVSVQTELMPPSTSSSPPVM
jgi:hypothetical protein